jgi:protein-tyrosine kinase
MLRDAENRVLADAFAETQAPPLEPPLPSAGHDRESPIGKLILRSGANLDAEQVARVIEHQKKKGLRFGEAAVSLGLASGEEVVQALSQQYRYPYLPKHGRQLHADLVMANRPFSPHAEVFRGIRAQLKMRIFAPGLPRRAIAVLSASDREGKSYFAANIAIAFSQLGGRTLLIDGDLRKPRQHELFGVANDIGLSTVLSGRTSTHMIHSVPDLPSLFVLPVGAVPPNPLELLEGDGFGLLFNDVLRKFDHVIVDTPAFRHGMDGPVIASTCGAALVVVRQGRTLLGAVQDLVATLSENPAEVAGVIMNDF